MIQLPNDHRCVQKAIMDKVDCDKYLNDLSIAQLESMKMQYQKYKEYNFKDTPIRAYVAELPLMVELKE